MRCTSSSANVVEDGDGPLQEGEEALEIVNGIARLQVGISLGSLTEDNERRWRNPLFEPPPLHICNQEERNEESVEIGVEEERVEERRREDTSEEEVKVNNTSQGRVSVSVSISPTTSGQSGGHNTRLSMENQDTTLRLPMFHGMGRDDAEQHWFTCEAIWSVKRITDEASKIVQLETTFRDKSSDMVYEVQGTALAGQARSLTKIKRDLLREFQKPKSKSQCITEIKEIKQQGGETIWDYDQRFKILLDRLTFQIQDVQHREWFIAGLLPHIQSHSPNRR
jgi:hypothetical protein